MIFDWSFNSGLVFGIDANPLAVENEEGEVFIANSINIHLSLITLRFVFFSN